MVGSVDCCVEEGGPSPLVLGLTQNRTSAVVVTIAINIIADLINIVVMITAISS